MRSVLFYSGVLATSLGGAWYRWTKAPDPTTGSEVVVLQGTADNIEQIIWESEDEKSILTMKEDTHGSYVWVEYTDNRPQTNKENPSPAVKEFKGGQKAELLLKKLSPLIGLRGFTDVTAEQEESFGLHEPTATVTITRRGRDQVLTIGGESYGTKDWYVRSEESKSVFLLDDLNLKNLKFARNQLVDRNLWSVDDKAITQIELSVADTDTLFEHHNWHDQENSLWRFVENPEADNAQLTNWVEKFLRTKGNRYADLDFDPNTLTEKFSVTLTDSNDSSETIRFGMDLEESWWATSPHTRGHLKVITQSIEPLFADVEALQNASISSSPESQQQ